MTLKKGWKLSLNGDTLKMIAVITMLIDHIAASLLITALRGGVFGVRQNEGWMGIYHIMRNIGRTAFPIFAFLLTEGFFHTGNRKKYLFRMGVFFLLSELPYDFAIYGRVNINAQNVYLTLFLGLCLMWALEKAKRLPGYGMPAVPGLFLQLSAAAAALIVCCTAAKILHCDYDMRGILLILLFYMAKGIFLTRFAACFLGYLLFSWEPWCIFGFLLILFYDGTRKKAGPARKYFFYFFYPVHLLILGIVRVVFFGG